MVKKKMMIGRNADLPIPSTTRTERKATSPKATSCIVSVDSIMFLAT